MPALTHAQAQQWIAFLLSLRGQANVFQLGDPLAVSPRARAWTRHWSMPRGRRGIRSTSNAVRHSGGPVVPRDMTPAYLVAIQSGLLRPVLFLEPGSGVNVRLGGARKALLEGL